jgi:hypothetical protein
VLLESGIVITHVSRLESVHHLERTRVYEKNRGEVDSLVSASLACGSVILASKCSLKHEKVYIQMSKSVEEARLQLRKGSKTKETKETSDHRLALSAGRVFLMVCMDMHHQTPSAEQGTAFVHVLQP